MEIDIMGADMRSYIKAPETFRERGVKRYEGV